MDWLGPYLRRNVGTLPGVSYSKDFTPGYYLSAPTALSIFSAYGIPAANDFTDELSDSFGTHRFSKDG